MQFRFTRVSETKKLGPIPSVISEASTCPTTCPLKNNGCYAENFPLSMWWKRLSLNLKELSFKIRRLPEGQLWRYAIAGDLPGDGVNINKGQLAELVLANKGRRGFTYTHYLPTPDNLDAIQHAIQNGFVINMSANNLTQADYYMSLDLPTAVVLPSGTTRPVRTPGGNMVVPCPATQGEANCSTCQLCSIINRRVAIGFPAHGAKKKLVNTVAGG